MFPLKLCFEMAAAVAYALLTASVPASSGERVANLGPDMRSSVPSPTRPPMA